jgi:crotonobetainyl-CoA:carnitine CoA-transferase CaiB-like acyl-CoA transferase
MNILNKEFQKFEQAEIIKLFEHFKIPGGPINDIK